MLTKTRLMNIYESIKFNVGDEVFIHHPITGELVTVNITKCKTSNVIVSIPEGSDYYGQPDFAIKKYKILSIK